MIDPKTVTPLLTNMSVDREIGRGPNGAVYQVTRRIDGRRMALKHIPIPASDDQTKALIYAGAVQNEAEAQRYYSAQVQDIKDELLRLNGIQNGVNLLKFKGYQVDQKITGTGYDIYLLSDCCRSLPEFLMYQSISRLQAVNLGIDLCSALEQLRSAGLVHKDVHPNNVFQSAGGQFLLGDLGLVPLEELPYNAMPDQLITEYTAPEVTPEDAPLTDTMDIYSVGLILYEIFNGCALPLDDEGHFIRTAEELPAPVCADMALSEIILKACAFDPSDRYQSPTDMKQALVLYLQRGNVTDEPLFPALNIGEDASAVDVSTIAATVEAGQAAESAERALEQEEAPGDPETAGVPDGPEDGAEPEPAELPAEEASTSPDGAEPDVSSDATIVLGELPTAQPKPSLNDLGDQDLLPIEQEEISVEDFLADLRKSAGLEVLSLDAQGNTSVVPGYETEETLPPDTEYVYSADQRAPAEAFTGQDGYHYGEESEPAVQDYSGNFGYVPAADVYDYDGGETAYEAPASEAPPAAEVLEEPPQEAPARKRRKKKQRQEPEPESYDDGYEDGYDYDEHTGGGWKPVLVTLIILLVLAAGAFVLYTFRTDTISDLESQVLSSSSVEITAKTRVNSAIEVVCSNASGEVATVPLNGGTGTFTGLDPNSSYTFSLRSAENKLLLGNRSVSAKTLQMTNLTSFVASSISATEVQLAVAGTGTQPESWIITLTGENGDLVSATADDVSQPILVEGLTPATAYTAEIARSDGDQLGGTTTCTFTTMEYTVLSAFEVTEISTESVTVAWDYSGTRPNTWTLTCEGTDGSSTTQDVAGNECLLDGLTSGVTYTIAIACPSLKPTDLSSLSVSIPTVTITEVSSIQDEDGSISVSWSFTGDMDPSHWTVSYTYASEIVDAPTLVTTDTNSLKLENPVPNAEYTFTVEEADGIRVGGNAETTCVTGNAAPFTSYGCSDVEMVLYVTEDKELGIEEPTTTFTTAQHIAFSIQASYDVTEEDKTVTALYIIRSESGLPVYVYRSDGRTWRGSWSIANHTGDLPDMPQTPGQYTLEVYFDGGLLAQESFTVTEE